MATQELLKKIYSYLSNYYDDGPEGHGWQSDDLMGVLSEVQKLISDDSYDIKVEAYDKIAALFEGVEVYGDKWIVLDCRPTLDLISVSTVVPFYSGETICRLENTVSGKPLNEHDLRNAVAISKLPDLLKILKR